MPYVGTGVLIVAGATLAAVMLAGNLAERELMLALARPVERGTVLTDADLTTVAVALDGGVPALPAAATDEVVGRRLVASLPSGALLSEELLAAGLGVADDERVVGLSLSPGQYPVSGLRAGDVVSVTAATPTSEGQAGAARVLMTRRSYSRSNR